MLHPFTLRQRDHTAHAHKARPNAAPPLLSGICTTAARASTLRCSELFRLLASRCTV